MALIKKKPWSRSTRGGSQAELVGAVRLSSYAEHARDPGVQELINSARVAWRERYDSDPAAARFE